MFYLNGNKSTNIPLIICSAHCPSLLSILLTAISVKKVTYSDYSGESRLWLSVFIVQKESVIIVLLKCTEIKLFNYYYSVHFKKQRFINTKQEK